MQCNDTRPPLDQIKLIQGNHLQQRRICEIYIEFAVTTQWHIEKNAQCNCTGPPDQIQLIHGERYIKTMVTLHLLIHVWVGNG